MFFDGTELADLVLRSAAIGQLLIIALLIARPLITGPNSVRIDVTLATGDNTRQCRVSKLLTIACLIGYLLLTAPVPDAVYGQWRGLLLLLTDALIYSLWLTALYHYKKDFSLAGLPLPIKFIAAAYAAWFGYFFLIKQGMGAFHDINHGLVFPIGIYIVFITLREYADDLVDRRRQSRRYATVFVSVYMMTLAAVELSPEYIRHHPLFSLSNALIIVLSALIYVALFATQHEERIDCNLKPTNKPDNDTSPIGRQLQAFIDEKGYLQPTLSVAGLANHIGHPEYKVRQYINQELGYRNFSDFVNHYRLAEAATQLAETAQSAASRKANPILTIALSSGFNSIGPFNRAFKQAFGETPSEYRKRLSH